jgi:hypothetical protein
MSTAHRPHSFPAAREFRALELGADELIARLEGEFRGRPRALRNSRRDYTNVCSRLYGGLQRRRRRAA